MSNCQWPVAIGLVDIQLQVPESVAYILQPEPLSFPQQWKSRRILILNWFLTPSLSLKGQRGGIICTLFVKPPITNLFKSLHGGALAAVAEIVSIACARTVVVEEKELSLGELSMSYLSGAPTNAEMIADGSVVRSGRNLTVVAVEFKFNKTGMLIYTARATFYNMPVSKL
ncbi:acyl-coenzyme A thioesterase 13-like [Quillaja saponaria]|uniref:Acyl-coenzyme A thioesterase 13-like n=1 Tax=Quillaja saponaria TaxID=32244 RepID=A0AAD7L4F0_QUISA|nr:acyl-coenzyme A thioesterase 13-like [Quillaja saponaria]